jgi:hypothetical protein
MNKKIIWGIVMGVIVIGVGIALSVPSLKDDDQIPYGNNKAPTSDWKTYTNTKDGYTFSYPTKLSLKTSPDGVLLTHSIPFENTDGGCDMVGNGVISKTLGDFNVLVSLVEGQVNPPYVDGTYTKGSLNGKWAYRGAEGCGQTVYYFPISGNRTLVITKQELQILSTIVAPDVRAKVLAVPGVIPREEAENILDRILSTFKFTSPTNTVQSKGSVSKHFTWQGISFDYPSTWNAEVWRYGSSGMLAEGKTNEVGFQVSKGMEVIKAGGPQSAGDTCANLKSRTNWTKCSDIKYPNKAETIAIYADSKNNETLEVFDSIMVSIKSSNVQSDSISIVVASPKAGEVLQIGKTYNVAWSNYPGTEDLSIALVGKKSNTRIAVAKGSLGKYLVIIPAVDTSDVYFIEVYPEGGRERVGRSGVFTITK